MRALVVYESMFGNTGAVAREVAAGIGEHLPVDVVEVSKAPAVVGDDVDLLVVGGPTHAMGMSRPQTRQSAADTPGSAVPSTEVGMREWVGRLPAEARGRTAATFDTRVRHPRMPGSAARAARRALRRRGFAVDAASTFWVTGTPGPLAVGEIERAHEWGERLAAQLAGAAVP